LKKNNTKENVTKAIKKREKGEHQYIWPLQIRGGPTAGEGDRFDGSDSGKTQIVKDAGGEWKWGFYGSACL